LFKKIKDSTTSLYSKKNRKNSLYDKNDKIKKKEALCTISVIKIEKKDFQENKDVNNLQDDNDPIRQSVFVPLYSDNH